MRRARELDPTDPLTEGLSSVVASQDRDQAAALEHGRRAISLDSGFWIGYAGLGQAYELAGDHALALETLIDATRMPGGGNSKVLSLKGYVLAKLGRADAAREVLATLEAISRERYVPPYHQHWCTPALGSATRCSMHSKKPTPCVTFISSTFPSLRSGIPTGRILDSSIYWNAAVLHRRTDPLDAA